MAVSELLGAGTDVSATPVFIAAFSSGTNALTLPEYVDGVGLLAAIRLQVSVVARAARAGLGCATLPRAVAGCEIGGETVSLKAQRASSLTTFAR